MSKILTVASNHKPRKLVSLVKEEGDDSFTIALDTEDDEIFKLLPDVARLGYEISHNSGVMLADLVCEGPHIDPEVGNIETKHAVFGLLSGG